MNFINNIDIKNFKSIRSQKIEGCKRINIFVGPPNVGKSNILEALGLLGLLDISMSQPITLNKLTRVNKEYQLFFDGLINEEIDVTLNNNLNLNISVASNLDIKFSAIEQLPMVRPADVSTWKDYPRSISLKRINSIGIDDVIKNESSNLNSYLNPIDSIRKYNFSKTSHKIQYDTLVKHLVFPFGENISSIIFSNPSVKNKILKLFEIFNLRVSRSENSGAISLLKELKDSSFLILDYDLIAETLQRLIFYIAAIISNKNSILLFEEPEANCFEPYIQEITNAIKNDENDNQFFIVTHSQFVIDELMRDEASRDNTNIYLVGLEDDQTSVKLLKPEVSKDVYQTGLNVFFNFKNLWDEN